LTRGGVPTWGLGRDIKPSMLQNVTQSSGLCDCDNEPLGSIKDRDLLDRVTLSFLRRTLLCGGREGVS